MGRILVVDDDTDIAEMLRQILVYKGHRADCLTRPARGQTWQETFLARVAEGIGGEPFHIVVLDTQLQPYGDGRDLARALAAHPGPRPKIMLVSAMASAPEGTRELLASGAIHGFTAKPFDDNWLLHAVEGLMAAPAATSDAHPAH